VVGKRLFSFSILLIIVCDIEDVLNELLRLTEIGMNLFFLVEPKLLVRVHR
jgi:hypothetical protein